MVCCSSVIAVELSPYSNEISLDWPLLQTLPGRVLDVMRNDTLLAIPFFTFMGIILEKSGMAEDLLDTVGQLFGPMRGGLAYAVILVGALLAATTGVVAASVIAMGLISLPIMLRYGYDRPLATGVIAASGTLAQIIPPSLVLIVLADQLGRSVGDMYAGAMIPGLMLAASIAPMSLGLVDPAPAEGAGAAAGGAHPEGKRPASLLVAAGPRLPSLRRLGFWSCQGMCNGAGIWAATIAAVAGLCHRPGRQAPEARPAVPSGAAGGHRAGAAAGADLPGAGNDLPGHRHAHRGRRHGGGGRTAAWPPRGAASTSGCSAMRWRRRPGCPASCIFILIGSRIFSLTFYGINGHVWVEELFLGVPGGVMGLPASRSTCWSSSSAASSTSSRSPSSSCRCWRRLRRSSASISSGSASSSA